LLWKFFCVRFVSYSPPPAPFPVESLAMSIRIPGLSWMVDRNGNWLDPLPPWLDRSVFAFNPMILDILPSSTCA
jgi:hypothetical protein